jgi:hypothetical protein
MEATQGEWMLLLENETFELAAEIPFGIKPIFEVGGL